jgi:hypothetical protein
VLAVHDETHGGGGVEDGAGRQRSRSSRIISSGVGKTARRLRLDPLLQILQGLEPPFSRRQLGDTAQLDDGLLRQAAVLGLGSGGQSLIDLVGQIADL